MLLKMAKIEGFCKQDNDTLISIKAAPLQAWSYPDGSRKLSFPDFMTTAWW